ncbi:MAG: BatD family protein [Saprospiraceae bacterium]
MRTLFFIFSFLFWVTLTATAQNEARFYVEANPVEVAVGDPIKVSFILENGKNNGRFTPPDWEAAGFMLIGSSQSSNLSFINGQTSSSASYNFTITPLEAGNFTIPAVSLNNDGAELNTEPVAIKVLANADGISPTLPKRSPAQPQREPKKKYKTIKM